MGIAGIISSKNQGEPTAVLIVTSFLNSSLPYKEATASITIRQLYYNSTFRDKFRLALVSFCKVR